MPELMLKLSPSLAAEIRSKEGASKTKLGRLLAKYQANLSDPTGDVGETREYFSAGEVASDSINKLIKELLRLPGVEAAYAKPSDAMP